MADGLWIAAAELGFELFGLRQQSCRFGLLSARYGQCLTVTRGWAASVLDTCQIKKYGLCVCAGAIGSATEERVQSDGSWLKRP
jgi:hypothetical protein